MEVYLRYYVNKRQNNWVTLLLIAQLAYNDKRLDITRLLPFFINYGRYANLFLDPRQGLDAEKALVLTSNIKSLYKDI
jgi:hypothetical protein